MILQGFYKKGFYKGGNGGSLRFGIGVNGEGYLVMGCNALKPGKKIKGWHLVLFVWRLIMRVWFCSLGI